MTEFSIVIQRVMHTNLYSSNLYTGLLFCFCAEQLQYTSLVHVDNLETGPQSQFGVEEIMCSGSNVCFDFWYDQKTLNIAWVAGF